MLLLSIKSNANSTFTSSSCSTRSMDIGINFFWGLKLHNQIDFGEIQSSCSNISSNETFKFSLFEGLEGNFSLLLGDVSMQNLGFLLQISFKQNFIGLPLSLAKDDCTTVSSSIKIDNISNDGVSVVVRAVHSKVLDCLGSPNVRVLN